MLFKWRKTLFVLGVGAALLSIFFSSSLFIAPLYRSTIIMYPASGNSVSRILLSEKTAANDDLLDYGDEMQAEQLLQVLSSKRITDKIIQKFKLDAHYGINPASDLYHTRLYARYDRNVSFKRTEYMAVKVSVLDEDPQLAADMANEIASLVDSAKQEMQKDRAVQGLRIVENQYFEQQKQVTALQDSLTKIRKLGVQDYESQAEMLNRQLAKEIAIGNSRGITNLRKELGVLAMYGGAYVSLSETLLNELKQLSFMKARYEEARVDATTVLPQKFIIEKAFRAERPSYPVIWLVALVSTVSTLLAGFLAIGFVEYRPEMLNAFRNNRG